MAKPEPYFVGIDIGSSKVGVLIGQRDAKRSMEVVGKGLAPNRGTRKGNIVNVEATVEALKQASEEAEVMAGVEISRAYVGVAGADIRSVNSRGMVSVSRKDREITRQDIQRVLEAAQSAALPSDREILHAVPQEFIVDEQGGIDEPLGMLGTRVEVMVHLVTGNITRSRTLLTCVNRAGTSKASSVSLTAAAASHGGGGALDGVMLFVLAVLNLAALRCVRVVGLRIGAARDVRVARIQRLPSLLRRGR